MINIHCTANLKEFLNPIIEQIIFETNEIWHAKLFYLNRKKCICFLDKKTLYTIVLFDVLKKDLREIKTLFIETLINQLYSDHILTKEYEPKIRELFTEINFYPTSNDRSATGSLNETVARIKCWNNIEQSKYYVSKNINKTPMATLKYQYSKDVMDLKIRTTANEVVISDGHN